MTQSTHSHLSGDHWATYYQAVEGRPPRETLLKALTHFDANPLPDRPRLAVDLGCGDGRDTVELLRRGWRVLAIDGEQKAFDRLLDRPDLNHDLLQTQRMRFEALTLPPAVDLNQCQFLSSLLSARRLPKALGHDRGIAQHRRTVLWSVVWRSRLMDNLSQSHSSHAPTS